METKKIFNIKCLDEGYVIKNKGKSIAIEKEESLLDFLIVELKLSLQRLNSPNTHQAILSIEMKINPPNS